MRVTVELTGEEILALTECYRMHGEALGAIRPDLRKDAHKAALVLGGAWKDAVAKAVSEDEVHEAHGGDESPDPESCPVCLRALDFFLCYGETDPTPGPCHLPGCALGAHSIGRPHLIRGVTPDWPCDCGKGDWCPQFGRLFNATHRDDGQCHDECWALAVAESEVARS